MLTGGGAQVVMRAVGSGCKYRWSFPHLPNTHLLLCSPVPNRPQTVPVCGPGVGDPCFKGWGDVKGSDGGVLAEGRASTRHQRGKLRRLFGRRASLQLFCGNLGRWRWKSRLGSCGPLRCWAEHGFISVSDQEPLKTMICDKLHLLKNLNGSQPEGGITASRRLLGRNCSNLGEKQWGPEWSSWQRSGVEGPMGKWRRKV